MTTLGVNIGDDFIREGICSFLDDLFEQWEPFYVNKHDLLTLHQPVEDEVSLLEDKFCDADIIIQAGAPVYWKIGDSTSYNVEWAEELWQKRIFRLGPNKPILNIAAGACQPYPDFARTFLSDPACIQFAREVHSACKWVSVRDPLASQILFALGLEHEGLPCTAFHAPRRTKTVNRKGKFLGVNFMPYGGHYKLKEDVDENTWASDIEGFLSDLRKRHPLLFIAHDESEKEFMKSYLSPGETVFYSPRWRDYLLIYEGCLAVIANRVHGAVLAAGFGIPSVIVGNDTRLLIGDYIDLPSIYITEAKAHILIELVEGAMACYHQERDRLLTLREETAKHYCQAIRESLESIPKEGTSIKNQSKVSLFSLSEMQSKPFRRFMQTVNYFSKRWGLNQFTNYPEIWTYPWLWYHGFSKANWKDTSFLFIGGKLNPMPWFIASMGAKVFIVERDCWCCTEWERIRDRTGLEVQWNFLNHGTLPFPHEKYDFVATLSDNGYLREQRLMIDELIRVLKPGGTLAISFNVCNSPMEKTVSKGDRKILTISQFEALIWNHPELETQGTQAEWNLKDIQSSIQWSSIKKNPKVLAGAAVLPKKKV